MRTNFHGAIVTALLLLFLLQDPPAAVPTSEWFPEDLVYRHPLADPRAPVTGVQFQFPVDSDDNMKVENRLATQIAIWRRSEGDGAFEVQAEGAVFGRFDFQEKWDMDGADFRFGFPVVWREGAYAFKIHPWHLTSHIGDEYSERTGVKRINYSRNELTIGVSWDAEPEWRVYGEIGYALWRGDVNEYWRLMGGVETVGRHLGPEWPVSFAALNLTCFQEQDWEVQFNLEAGVWFRPEGTNRGVRFHLGYFRGPSALTQFLVDHEEYWTFGFALPF